jgi:putative FmdB family regulatory protein
VPTYRYRCEDCGKDFEVWQSIKDDALTEHDACGGELKKVLSAAGIVLKGPGFYKTDSRSGSGNGKTATKERDRKPEKSEKSDGSSSGSGGSGSTGGTGGTESSGSSGSSRSGESGGSSGSGGSGGSGGSSSSAKQETSSS